MRFPQTHRLTVVVTLALIAMMLAPSQAQQQQSPPPAAKQGGQDSFRFRTGVELINVTATVTDSNGRFISGLRKEDFTLYEDGQPQQISHFNNERVPVSLGITLDTSGSMAGEKFVAAQGALDRFLFDLLDAQDHVFLTRFSNHPIMVHDWTTDRTAVSRALSRVIPNGGTAMYDAVAEAVPIAESGTHRKKALVIISDGNDTNSSTTVPELKQMIRESEVLVYAIGIDGSGRRYGSYQQQPAQQQPPMPRLPIPLPFPGARRPPTQPPPQPPPSYPPTSGGRTTRGRDEAVNVQALREITDDTGGRTEIIYSAQDLNPATSGIASELNQQYYLGYAAPSTKDGRWHSIRVEVRQRDAIVRARRGYVATP